MENKSPFGVAESEFDEQGYDSTNESDLEISSDKKKKVKLVKYGRSYLVVNLMSLTKIKKVLSNHLALYLVG